MDTIGLDLTGCVPWCRCESCMVKAAALHIRRLLWGRYLVTHGIVSEDLREEPSPRLDFYRWLVARGVYSEWNIADDPMPMPERLHRAWNRTEVAA